MAKIINTTTVPVPCINGIAVVAYLNCFFYQLINLEKQGKVFASGPMFDKEGEKSAGITVFSTETWEEAEALAADDPFCASGAMEFSLKRWQINEGRINIAVDFSDSTFSIA